MTTAAPDEIRSRLKQHYLFNGFDDASLNALAQAVRRVTLEPGEILFHQGAPAERFYLVGAGQIKLSRISPAGQEKVIEVMYPGSTFAEAVMFMHKQAYPVTAQALAESVLYGIPNQAYRNILAQSTEYCFRLLADLSMRLHQHVQEIDHLSQQNAMHRLIRYLLYQVPADARSPVILNLDIPKQILASKLSIKPESFSRLLALLSDEGIISVDKQTIAIHDVERLKNYE
jgi:CRP/FNR family transcriptional regulator, dissimilatory nitrate respiration regulator